MNHPNLLNRAVSRIALHNGVHVSVPGKNGAAARSDVVKQVFCESPIQLKQGKICAERMTLVPIGVFCEFPGGMEKLVPFANIYEADLLPLFSTEAVGDAETTPQPARRGRPPKSSSEPEE